MSNFIKALIVILIVVIIPVLGFFGMYVTYHNKDAELRNLIETKQRDNTNVFDATWKIIKQQANVAEEYKDSFKEIYPELIAGRYSNDGGTMMKWIQEHNPEFDSSLYKQLMVSIESQRLLFMENQTRLLDFKREHDNLRTRIPSSFFVSNIPIEVMIVTSSQTDQVFQTGKDDDVSLFKD
jgi:hypothetical protein